MCAREFRTTESYDAERVTRDMILGYLHNRSFRDLRDERKFHGKVESQTIHATASSGERLVMRVRLCWRRKQPSDTYSASQILPKIKNNDWEGTLQTKIDREIAEGVTHTLFVQREIQGHISYAVLVPQAKLLEIWCAQRDVSKTLISAGKLGRKKKNHAMNGSSPTLWLNDDKAPTVTEVLWKHPSILNIAKLNLEEIKTVSSDDTFDDLQGIDYSLFGSDGGAVTVNKRSNVKRDPRVRKAVIIRAQGKCERSECGASRGYPGFLDVHHILGVEKSDRVWNCVALCPSCHRETHAAPNRDEINTVLLNLVICYKR